ncbi:hypothetical protein ON010_g12056 [Phytophthora cinnamomi]|nr:hypothetical protein ON010_g12056 [Phytophthora cinnamomi]
MPYVHANVAVEVQEQRLEGEADQLHRDAALHVVVPVGHVRSVASDRSGEDAHESEAGRDHAGLGLSQQATRIFGGGRVAVRSFEVLVVVETQHVVHLQLHTEAAGVLEGEDPSDRLSGHGHEAVVQLRLGAVCHDVVALQVDVVALRTVVREQLSEIVLFTVIRSKTRGVTKYVTPAPRFPQPHEMALALPTTSRENIVDVQKCSNDQEHSLHTTSPVAIAQRSYNETAEDGAGERDDVGVRHLVFRELELLLDRGHERWDGEPPEECNEEGQPRVVERSHVRALEAEEPDFGGFVALVRIGANVKGELAWLF